MDTLNSPVNFFELFNFLRDHCSTKITPNQRLALLCIASRNANNANYLVNQKTIAQDLGLEIRQTRRILEYLISISVIKSIENGCNNNYYVSINYSECLKRVEEKVVKEKTTPVVDVRCQKNNTGRGCPVSTKESIYIKENKRDIGKNGDITLIKNNSQILFDKFWALYPKKTSLKKCKIFWQSHKLEKIAGLLIVDVENRIAKHEPWASNIRDGTLQYIPDPIRYLREEMWQDAIILNKKNGGTSDGKITRQRTLTSSVHDRLAAALAETQICQQESIGVD